MFRREWLEQMLREPNNLFGQPNGAGYDYRRASIVLAAMAATVASTAATLLAFELDSLATPIRAVLLLIAITNLIGYPFLWPLSFLVGLVTSFLLWLSAAYFLAWFCKWRDPSLAVRWIATIGTVAGWLSGLAIYLWLLIRWNG